MVKRPRRHDFVVGAEGAEGAFDEGRPDAPRTLVFVQGGDVRIAAVTVAEDARAGRDRVVDDDPGHVLIGLDAQRDAPDVAAADLAGVLLLHRRHVAGDAVADGARRGDRDGGQHLQARPGLAAAFVADVECRPAPAGPRQRELRRTALRLARPASGSSAAASPSWRAWCRSPPRARTLPNLSRAATRPGVGDRGQPAAALLAFQCAAHQRGRSSFQRRVVDHGFDQAEGVGVAADHQPPPVVGALAGEDEAPAGVGQAVAQFALGGGQFRGAIRQIWSGAWRSDTSRSAPRWAGAAARCRGCGGAGYAAVWPRRVSASSAASLRTSRDRLCGDQYSGLMRPSAKAVRPSLHALREFGGQRRNRQRRRRRAGRR